MVATALARHVAAMTEPKSMPATESTAGWTKIIYAMVMKVVTPAVISVLKFVSSS